MTIYDFEGKKSIWEEKDNLRCENEKCEIMRLSSVKSKI